MPPVLSEHRLVSREEKIFTFLVVLMAWANVYALPSYPIGIGEIIFFLFIPLYYSKKITCSIRVYEFFFFIWFVYAVLVTLILMNYFDAPISKFFSIARVFFYWILIFFFGKNLFELNLFKKFVNIFATLLSVFIVVQLVVYILKGFLIPGFFLNVSLNDGGMTGLQLYEKYVKMAGWTGVCRPNGFLCEPAHCSEFLFIALIIMLNEKKLSVVKKMQFILFSLAIVFTQSTEGILLLTMACFIYVLIEKKYAFLKIPFFVLLLCSSVLLFTGFFSTGMHSIDRIINIVNGSNDIDNSSLLRLNNGFGLFFELPISFQLFGTGLGLFDYVFEEMSILNAQKFMNTFSVVFFMSGFLGALVWNLALVVFFRKSGLLGKCLVLGFVAMSMGSSIFCQPQMVWIFLLIIDDIRKKNDRCSCVELQ